MFEQGDILTYEPLEDPPGIEVIDQLERLRYQLWTAESVSPSPADPDSFHFPVTGALAMTTQRLSFPVTISVVVRDAEGNMLANVGHLEEESVGEGQYILELGAQIKTYIEVEGPFEITSDLIEKEIGFDEPRVVRVGVRSRHERPAATVTTTDDPRDMMAAISTFGSALKSTSPERSYPTLRGHPPDVELGEELDIPATVEPPETGIRIEIPETYEAVYTVAPLAYYLGATVEPGSTPRLVTDEGFEHPLDYAGSLQTGVARTLKQLFTFDCVTRVDGLYDINLHERNVVEERVDLDFERLYESSLPEQVATYLSIPYETVEDCVPTWRLTAHVEPDATGIELLPFVVNDLALVEMAETPDTGLGPAQEPGEEVLTRAGAGAFTRSVSASSGSTDVLTRSASTRSTTSSVVEQPEPYVEPQSSDSLEQAWIGEGIPIGATKLTKQAYENWFGREIEDGDISITIVVNDERMSEERDLVDDIYGDRDDLPFDIDVHDNLSVSEFRELLERDCSFFHYIGHVEDEGFMCADGMFDAAELDSTGIDSFMLNACDSYEQGLNLVDAGAVGGIVTLNEVLNDEAVKIGETIAHLLNAGFPLDSSLSLAREESVLGGQYIIVGAGGLTVTQQPTRVPHCVRILDVDEIFRMTVMTYASNDAGLGTIFHPFIGENEEYFLASGNVGEFNLTAEQLDEFIGLQNIPLKVDGALQWSASLFASDLK